MAAVTTKMVDERGRLSLGREFAERLVIVKRVAVGVLQIVMAEAVPARESWLYKNAAVLNSVMQGLEDAKHGDLVEGPDRTAGDALLGDMED